jgi:hypothetical protein
MGRERKLKRAVRKGSLLFAGLAAQMLFLRQEAVWQQMNENAGREKEEK